MEPDFSELSLYLPSLPAGSPLPDSITLEQCWQEAEDAFSEAQSVSLQMLVIFGGQEDEQRCLTASAVVTEVSAGGAGTRIRFKEVLPILSRPLVPSLRDEEDVTLDTEELMAARLVSTPLFLLEEAKTFLLTWNPLNQVSLEKINEVRAQMMAGEVCSWQWTCRSVNRVSAGARFLMLRQGPEPRGIIGSGWIRTDAWFDDEDTPMVDILWRRLVDPERPLDPKMIQGAKHVHWTPNGSGTGLPEDAYDAVWAAWEAHSANDHAAPLPLPPSENEASSVSTAARTAPQEDAASSVEGRLVEGWSSRRERDPANRARCLAAHGYRCAVCAMSFAEEYGEIGEGFIHIHHEQPLAASDDAAGAVHDPETTMKPVCPNCHAMLHRGQDATRGEVRSIAELKALRAQALSVKGFQERSHAPSFNPC